MASAPTSPRPTRRRDLAAAAVVFCVLVVLAEVWFRHARFHAAAIESSGYLARPEKFRALRHRPDVVALGSSRIRAGVSTTELFDAGIELCGRPLQGYNMGVSAGLGSETLAMATAVLSREGPAPRVALVYGYARSVSSLVEPGNVPGRRAIGRSFPASAAMSMVRAGFSADAIVESVLSDPLQLLRMRGEVLRRFAGKRLRVDARERPYYLGWTPMQRVSPGEQRRRMNLRSREEAALFDPASAEWVDQDMAAFEEAVRVLAAAGTKVWVLESPASSGMRDAISATPLYRRYMGKLRDIARRHHALFGDHAAPPVIDDASYHDHNHLTATGARRYTSWLAREVVAPALRCEAPREPLCRPVDALAATNWARSQPFAWARRASRLPDWIVPRGSGPVISSGSPDEGSARGGLDSPEFRIEAPRLLLDVAGSGGRAVRIELWVDGRRVRSARPGGTSVVHAVTLDVSRWQGRRAHLRLVDRERRGYVAFEGARQCARWTRSGTR